MLEKLEPKTKVVPIVQDAEWSKGIITQRRWCIFGFYYLVLTPDNKTYIMFEDEIEEDK